MPDVYYAANNRNVFVASTKEDIIVKELYFSTPVNHMGWGLQIHTQTCHISKSLKRTCVTPKIIKVADFSFIVHDFAQSSKIQGVCTF